MKWIVYGLLWSAGWAGAAEVQRARLAPEQVEAAIAWGRTASVAELAQYELKAAETWVVECDTPFLRVAQLAAGWARKGDTPREADISPKLLANEVDIYVHARLADGNAKVLPNFEYVMLKRPAPNGRTETVMPRSFERFVRQVPIPGYYGPARVTHSLRASFPLSALVPGAELRVLLAGGAVESVLLDATTLARVR